MRVLPMVLLGLFLGPVTGMLVVEYSTGDPNSFAAKEAGFEGFLYGLWVGPCVGLVVGLCLHALRKRQAPRP